MGPTIGNVISQTSGLKKIDNVDILFLKNNEYFNVLQYQKDFYFDY